MITLLYFAGLKEKIGKQEEQLPYAGHTVRELLEHVQSKYDGFQDIVHVAVNEEYASLDDVLQENDVVAFIPPVSGG